MGILGAVTFLAGPCLVGGDLIKMGSITEIPCHNVIFANQAGTARRGPPGIKSKFLGISGAEKGGAIWLLGHGELVLVNGFRTWGISAGKSKRATLPIKSGTAGEVPRASKANSRPAISEIPC